VKHPEPHLKYILDDLAVIRDRMPRDKKEFAKDMMLQDATLMRLIDIGEQLIGLRENFPEFYQQHDNDTWHKLIGIRNIIAHGYHQVRLDIIWDITTVKLDEFTKHIKSLL